MLLLIPLALVLAGCRLNVATSGTGSGSVVSDPAGISCQTGGEGTCSVTAPAGLTVGTLTAVPDPGSVFAGWTGCTPFGNPVGAVCSGSLDSNSAQEGTVTAAFTLAYAVDVTVDGTGGGSVSSNPGGITCSTACVKGFEQGTAVTLSATPAQGSVFTGWAGACTGAEGCEVTTDAIKAVTATFDLAPVFRDLSVGIGGHGSGSVVSAPDGVDCDDADECVVQFADGAEVTLTATPAQGSVFAGWQGEECSGTGTCTVTMSEARQVLATFDLAEVVHQPQPEPARTAAPACGEGANSITCGVQPGRSQTITLGEGTPAKRITVQVEGADGAGSVTVRTIEGDSRDGVLGDVVELNANGFAFRRATVCLPGPDPELLEELRLRLDEVVIIHDHEGDRSTMTPSGPDASGRVCVVVGQFSSFWLAAPERTVRSTNGGPAATAASWALREHADGAATVYLASSAQSVDALLAASRLGESGVPLLLTDTGALPVATRRALERLDPSRIVVFGGVSAVSDAVLEEAAKLTGATVTRVSGTDRHATAAAISRLGATATATHVYLVNGDTGADLPAAAAAAARRQAALLLTGSETLPAATAERLAELSPEQVTVVGGPAAVSDAVLEAVRSLTGAQVERVSGPDRQATAAKLTRAAFRGPQPVAFTVDGADPGAVAAAVAAAASGGSAVVVTDGQPSRALERMAPRHVIQFGAGPV